MTVTLHEVAARAEVSIATVSRALNGLPVSQKSRERVEQAVAELGYVANAAARSLRSDRTMTMGLIFHDLRNILGVELVDALSESIEGAGYSLLISTARGDGARYDTLIRRFLERRVDALFCISPHGKAADLAHYRAANLPVLALFTAGGAFAGLPTLSPTFSEPAKALGEQLRALGHRRVTVLRGAVAADAIATVLEGQGLTVDRLEVTDAGGVREALTAVMAGAPRPTAILAPDATARALIFVCADAGVRVPQDVSVISLADITAEARHQRSGVASVTIDPHRMGRAAGAAMLAWLGGSPPPSRSRVQVATFTSRGSLGSASGD